MRLCVIPLIVAALQASTAAAPQTPLSGAVRQAQSTPAASSGSREQQGPATPLPVDLEKIRQALENTPPAAPAQPLRIGELPTFRVTVYGRRKPLLPDFAATLKQEWQPVVPGGIHNKEIMDMITPPQARAFGAFTGGDLAEVAGSALINALIQRALVAGYHALTGRVSDWREEQIRREVAAELAAFLLANPDAPRPAPKIEDRK